jgi:hypothetical protein
VGARLINIRTLSGVWVRLINTPLQRGVGKHRRHQPFQRFLALEERLTSTPRQITVSKEVRKNSVYTFPSVNNFFSNTETIYSIFPS